MCGIAGQVRLDGRPVPNGLVERMCSAIGHRGPDAMGSHVEGGVGLGIRRLSVIDLHTGDQPIYNEDGSVFVVLNGEIYNYRELRERLRARGHVFKTMADTEVIVHLYEDLGDDCVRELAGMFAFALWDGRHRRLLIARDRVGKKPLLYCHRRGVLSFASEHAALLQDSGVPRDVDRRALDAYFARLYVPAPATAFQAVRKLPPGHRLTFDERGLHVERYWRLRYTPKRQFSSKAEVHEAIREGLRAAVRRRMVADVPLGAFLSGGIDSAAVVAAMAEASDGPVETFSIGFPSDEFNELPLAARVARHFGTEHHELMVDPDAVELIPRLVRHYGEPFADSSAIPSFRVAEMARQHVTVALNGDGGDESFAGYGRYATAQLAARTDGWPLAVRRAVSGLANGLPARGRHDGRYMRGRRLAQMLPLSPVERYKRQVSALDAEQRRRLYTDEYLAFLGDEPIGTEIDLWWEDATGEELIDQLLEIDVNAYLPGDLLFKMDIASMAHGLEARSPFLDHELMELAAAIPAHYKSRGMETKVLLRDALRGWVPDDVLDGPKRGFSIPLASWFRNELRGLLRDTLLEPRTAERGYFHAPMIETLIAEHGTGRFDHAPLLWSLLMHELWHREFVDAPAGGRSEAPAPLTQRSPVQSAQA